MGLRILKGVSTNYLKILEQTTLTNRRAECTSLRSVTPVPKDMEINQGKNLDSKRLRDVEAYNSTDLGPGDR